MCSDSGRSFAAELGKGPGHRPHRAEPHPGVRESATRGMPGSKGLQVLSEQMGTGPVFLGKSSVQPAGRSGTCVPMMLDVPLCLCQLMCMLGISAPISHQGCYDAQMV